MIVVRAPFRLPLGGGGTDLPSYYQKNEGFLITAAINKYMFININEPAIVNKIKINYSKVEIICPQDIDSLQHEIVRESLKYLKAIRPMEISSMADLSAGTGMGSSSSYAVGLLKALNAMLRRDISTHELAEEACKVEIELIGKPIGKQDQFASAFGGIIQLDIDRLGNVTVTPLDLDHEVIYELENRLLMFYTDMERDANQILGEQSKKISEAKPEKNKSSALDYMDKIKNIGYKIKETLLDDDIDSFGKLLHEHWLTKKSVSDKMSNSKIDDWYDLAMKNGAIGGKIMGAGGGGFLLLCTENGKRKHLRKTMESAGLKYMDFKFDFEGAKVLVNI
ncbi:MAG TPA: galactokinase [Ignavibacteria bacterium]|nr:galactokinase [Ignavibacteria bacterium]